MVASSVFPNSHPAKQEELGKEVDPGSDKALASSSWSKGFSHGPLLLGPQRTASTRGFLKPMISGIPLILGLGIGMSDPADSLFFWAPSYEMLASIWYMVCNSYVSGSRLCPLGVHTHKIL